MKSFTTERFRKAYNNLPKKIQKSADRAFKLWSREPNHKSLRFKQIHTTKPIFSVRVGLGWRAIGVKEGDSMVWFWIGSHSDYDKLISQL